MFGISETELVIIILFAFMIFGPDKLPGMGRTLGRALRQFRQAQEGFTKVVQTEVLDPAAEIMNADPKKPNRKRTDELEDEPEDLDADIEDGASLRSRTRKKETFAERKARLAAERARAEEDSAGTDAEESGETQDEHTSKGGPSAESITSAADLYAITPKKKSSSRKEASAQKKTAAAQKAVKAEDEHEHSHDESGEEGASKEM